MLKSLMFILGLVLPTLGVSAASNEDIMLSEFVDPSPSERETLSAVLAQSLSYLLIMESFLLKSSARSNHPLLTTASIGSAYYLARSLFQRLTTRLNIRNMNFKITRDRIQECHDRISDTYRTAILESSLSSEDLHECLRWVRDENLDNIFIPDEYHTHCEPIRKQWVDALKSVKEKEKKSGCIIL
jgi:hypothetical protein